MRFSTMFPALVLFFILSASASTLDDCSTKCDASPKKDACMKGCMYAYALSTAPEPLAERPSCKQSCVDNLSGDDVNACETGCEQFANSEDGLGPLRLMLFMRDLVSRLFSGQPEGTPTADSESEPITITRIRIIPIGEPEPSQQDFIPPELLQPAEQVNEQPHQMPPHFMVMHRASADSSSMSVNEDMSCWFRRMLHAPFLLLFVVTLSTLIILLFVQLAVCIRRRHSTTRGYQYTPLPTYAEATNVKVPLCDDDELKQPLKQQEIDA